MKQLELPAKGRGGRRPGAGRPKKPGAGNSHLRRANLQARFPLHVNLRVRPEVGSLRTDKRFARIQRAFRYGGDRFGMRLVEFSVQGNHLHFIVEADGKRALTRGMQGLAIRLAKGVNRVSGRRGKVFADRYFARPLRTPNEVRNAVNYVRKNLHKHRREHPWYVDPYSSMSGEACWHVEGEFAALVLARPITWLSSAATGRGRITS